MMTVIQIASSLLVTIILALTIFQAAGYLDETNYQLPLYQGAGILESQLAYQPLLRSSGLIPQQPVSRFVAPKIFVSEDENYSLNKSITYSGLGSVAGVSSMPGDKVALFQRAHVVWQAGTFDGPVYPSKARRTGLIRDDSIVVINGTSGEIIKSFGADRFYMPHGISTDSKGNIWVTDAALHQVLRYPADRLAQPIPAGKTDYEPDIVLGEAFVPGTDSKHFCKPTDVAVAENGIVFISDGYCNSRVMVFSPRGEYLDEFGGDDKMYTPHSLALIESQDLLCVADRDNARILCYSAGLRGDLRAGRLLLQIPYVLGRVFAIDHIASGDDDLLFVVSISAETGKPETATFNLNNQQIVQVWSSNKMQFPHDISVSSDKRSLYVADASKGATKKVFKFNLSSQPTIRT